MMLLGGVVSLVAFWKATLVMWDTPLGSGANLSGALLWFFGITAPFYVLWATWLWCTRPDKKAVRTK